MRPTPDLYLSQLHALLPTGAAWPREPDTVLTKVLLAMADGLARGHNRALDLIEEADPRTAFEMLADWERVCGLPDPCSAGIATTLQERRAAVVTRLVSTGGQSISYFRELIVALGYDATVEEFRPAVAGIARCGHRLNGLPSVRFIWRVTVHGPRVTRARAGVSQAGDKLAKITRAEDLHCVLQRLKPGHTTLVIAYEGA